MKKKIAVDVLSVGLADVVTVGLGLASTAFLARTLSAHGFGQMAFAISIATVLSVVTEFGANLSGSRRVAQARDDQELLGRLFVQIIALRVVLSGVVISAWLLVTALVPILSTSRLNHAMSCLLVVGNAILPLWFIQGRGLFARFASAQILARVTTLVGLIATVRSPNDVWLAIAWQAATPLITFVLVIPLLKRELQGAILPTPDRQALVAEARYAWPFASTVLAHQSSSLGMVAILGFVLSPASVAYFSLSEKIAGVASMVMNAVKTAVYPRVSRLAAENPQAVFQFNIRLFRFVGPVGIAATIFIFVFAEPLLNLAGGESYRAAVPVLHLLALAPLLAVLSDLFAGLMLLPLGMEKALNRMCLLGSAGILLLIWPVAGRWDVVGAATLRIVHDVALIAGMGWLLWTQSRRFMRTATDIEMPGRRMP